MTGEVENENISPPRATVNLTFYAVCVHRPWIIRVLQLLYKYQPEVFRIRKCFVASKQKFGIGANWSKKYLTNFSWILQFVFSLSCYFSLSLSLSLTRAHTHTSLSIPQLHAQALSLKLLLFFTLCSLNKAYKVNRSWALLEFRGNVAGVQRVNLGQNLKLWSTNFGVAEK